MRFNPCWIEGEMKFNPFWKLMEFRFSKLIPPAIAMAILLTLHACRREERRFDEVSPGTNPGLVLTSDLQPGGGSATLSSGSSTPYDENAFAMNEGKRLFGSFNCTG